MRGLGKGDMDPTQELKRGGSWMLCTKGTSPVNCMRQTLRNTQGLENFSDIVTQRWSNRPYVLNLPWLIIHFKKQKIPQRILIGPRLSQHSIQNVQDPKLLGLQRKRKMESVLKGKNNQDMPTKMNQMLE